MVFSSGGDKGSNTKSTSRAGRAECYAVSGGGGGGGREQRQPAAAPADGGAAESASQRACNPFSAGP
jgi:hypothetical protein